MHEWNFEAIGTQWKISIVDTLAEETQQDLLQKIHTRIDQFDRDYSRFRDDSLVAEMAKQAGEYALPADAKPILDLYHALYGLTGGHMTPLIGQTLSDAGYDAAYTLVPKKINATPAWEDVLYYSFPTLTLKKPALLDFGAAGKGYLVDIVSQILKDAGVQSFVVDAGGDMYAHDILGKETRVGLEHPEHIDQAIGVATISNQSICGSSGNRRAWGEFHHIINPHTDTSPRTLAAVWVVAKTALLADALTTTLFFVLPDVLHQHYAFEHLLVYADYTVERSNNFPAELFTTTTSTI